MRNPRDIMKWCHDCLLWSSSGKTTVHMHIQNYWHSSVHLPASSPEPQLLQMPPNLFISSLTQFLCLWHLYVNVINVIFSCFTAVLMGWVKFETSPHFGYHVCNFYVIYQFIIYILIKWFDFVFLFIPSLCWCRGTGLWVIQCIRVGYSPECHQSESIPNYFTIFDFIFNNLC